MDVRYPAGEKDRASRCLSFSSACQKVEVKMKQALKTKAPNRTELIILAAVFHRPRYGLEVKKEVEKRTGRSMPVGSLYSTLNRMERAGFVESVNDVSGRHGGGNKRRNVYVTSTGRKVYATFLESIRLETR